MNDRSLIELARSLPVSDPPRDRVEEMRTAVLASMPAPIAPRPHRSWVVPAVAATAAAAAVIIAIAVLRVDGPAEALRRHATVTALGDATMVRVGTADDEIIRLTEGLIHLEVSPLAPGERCRVLVGDGEVEVRGTGFEVEAHHDRLARVRVTHGRVEVHAGATMVVLFAGDHWEPTVRTAVTVTPRTTDEAPLPPGPAPVRRHRRAAVVSGPPAPAPALASPVPSAEAQFRAAWSALTAGDAATAARTFEVAGRLDPAGPLAEDSAYWRAIALQRAGDHAGARKAFEQLLAEFPRSARAGEASVMLARELVAVGDRAGAERQLRRALTDRLPRVRALAATALEALAPDAAP